MRVTSHGYIEHEINTTRLFILLFIIFGYSCSCIYAQTPNPRPGIGLVLSGGGAHGIAHLGVIKVMEEAGLRPDYITGVSMGSIIGGMYSIGYSADSIEKILKTINWKLIMSNKLPEDRVIYLEKEHFNNNVVTIPLSLNKVKLPSGLINGQQIENMLSYYAWPAADIRDFSKLPIPFMCLGTDITRLKKVNLTSGYLADAIRASMSVPSVFSPIKIDSLLLVDGGLVRNFAASEIIEMGANIIIGSYVGFDAPDEDELQSLSGILRQIALFRSLEDFNKEKVHVNVLIEPKTHGYPLFEFENVSQLVKAGYDAAVPFREYFKKLADSLNQFGMQKPIKNILGKEEYIFDKVEIKGNKNYADWQVMGVLNVEPGEKITRQELTEKIDILYGKTWFDKVKYRVVPRNDSLVLVIDCIEKPMSMFYGSVYYDNYIQAGFVLRMSLKDLLTKNSVIKMNSFVSQDYRLNVSATQFLDRNQKFGLSLFFNSDNTSIPMLELKGNKGNVLSNNFNPGVSINRSLGLNHIMSLSLSYENLNLRLRYNSDVPLRDIAYNYLTAGYNYSVNSLDNKHFPERGTVLNISASTSKLQSARIRTITSKTVYVETNPGRFSFDSFITLSGHFRQYFPIVKKLTFAFGGDFLFITKSDSTAARNNFYLLGGPESISRRSVSLVGFNANEIPVRKMAGIRAALDYKAADKIHLTLISDLFAAQEADRNNGFSFISGYGLEVGYESIIGPLKTGIMHGNYDRETYFRKTKVYLSIGYKF
jgi:NTE family protein